MITSVLPRSGPPPARRGLAVGRTPTSRSRCSVARFCGSVKKARISRAVSGPMSRMAESDFGIGFGQRLERTEALGEQHGRALADLRDAERVDQPVAAAAAGVAWMAVIRLAADFSPMRSSSASCSAVRR